MVNQTSPGEADSSLHEVFVNLTLCCQEHVEFAKSAFRNKGHSGIRVRLFWGGGGGGGGYPKYEEVL